MSRKETGIIAGRLKALIDIEGPEYLSGHPENVYRFLVQDTDRILSAAILYTLLAGVNESAKQIHNREELSALIGKACSLEKTMADDIAGVYVQLYSPENFAMWDNRKLSGLRAFKENEQEFAWNGFYAWDAGNGTMDCSYRAQILAIPVRPEKNSRIAEQLSVNPFLSTERIHELFQESLRTYLDHEFEEYCGCDDYYPPVSEDFDIEYDVQEWCEENGFEMIRADGEGCTGDYEPKSYGSW